MEEYIAMARDLAIVYLDLTFSRSPRGLVARFVREVGSEKVVWGSDGWFMSNCQQIGKVLGAEIDDQDKERILSLNAPAILERVR